MKRKKNIEDGLNENKSILQIANEINRSHSTILRKIDRNKKFTTANNWNIGKKFENPNYLRKCEKLDKSPYLYM